MTTMAGQLREFLERVKTLPLFEELDFTDINAVNSDGENALHIAVWWQDIEAVKLLLAAGINIDQPGDLGHTPLHEACMRGSLEIVRLLVEHGADLFALTEGHPPFTTARFANNDHICDYLAGEMKKRQREDPAVWVRARIRQLQAEIDRLEKQVGPHDQTQGAHPTLRYDANI
ncbi:MAG TPA: ankyrin repeat domain-containing protein [Gemmataceae bacterium]|nr:ankyrin repeat domain-containing protein [Gemmataceae bacterium]